MKAPLRRGCALSFLTVLLLAMHASAGEKPPAASPEMVALVPGDQRPVEIVASHWDAEHGEARATLRSTLGIFAVHLDLTKTKATRFQLVIAHERHCEGLRYQSADCQGLDLLSAPGVTIQPQGKDLLITFTPPALEALRKQPGNLQFVNQYR